MELRQYQQEISTQANEVLKKYGLVYLALEVRTGKTITALETCRLFGASKVLFVTKKKAIGSILKDYDNFKNSFELVCINYESVGKHVGVYDIAIIDEAHSLGAFPKQTKRVKDLLFLKRSETPLIYLSGTPTPENYSQIFHQLFISYNSPFTEANFYKWAAKYVDVKTKYLYNREIKDYSGAIISKIEPLTKKLFISYTQKEAGFEVKINEEFHMIEMKQSTKSTIEKLKRDNIVQGSTGVILADTAVKLMNKIHQLGSGTIILEDNTHRIIDRSKIEFIKKTFKGQKIAIFYKFKAEFEMLKEYFFWTANPEEFQQSTELVFLGQFQSAREGIRLDTADCIIMLNIDYSFLSYEQAKNRLMSKERTDKATIHWLLSDCGLERLIYGKVTQKKNYTLTYFKHDFRIKNTKKDSSKA